MDGHADEDTDESRSVKSRLEKLEQRFGKRKKDEEPRPFHGVPIEEIKRREELVSECVKIGMSVEHMVAFLPTWGVSLSRSQIYEYLIRLRVPKRYERARGNMSPHDRETFDAFVRIAVGASEAGYRAEGIEKNRPVNGVRFRPDLRFELNGERVLLFFMEMQLSPLRAVRWRDKFLNYIRLYRHWKKPFRVLFCVSGDLDRMKSREYCRRVMERYKGSKQFLFCSHMDLQRAENPATESIWYSAWDSKKPLALLE